MASSWIAGTTLARSSSATSISVTSPATVAAGDVLLAFVKARWAFSSPSGTPITAPAGWTKIATASGADGESSTAYLEVWSKNTVTGADANTSFTFSRNGTGRIGATMACVRGGYVANAVAQFSGSDPKSPPAQTAAADGALMLVACGPVTSLSTSVTITPPSGATLWTGASNTYYEVSAAYQLRDAGQSNSGSFTHNGDGSAHLRATIRIEANLSFEGFWSASSPIGQAAVLGAAWPIGAVAADGPLGAVALMGSVGECTGLMAADGPLGAVALLGQNAVAARLALPGPLGAPSFLARQPVFGALAVSSMLGAGRVLALHDFTPVLGDLVTRYVMDVVTPGGLVRVPISSWQATLQTGSSCYVQCVVPACLDWVTALQAGTEFVISRTAQVPAGPLVVLEMARAPLEQLQFDRGPTNYTATLSGYTQAFAQAETPVAATDRVLRGVRSVSSGAGKIRVRCAVDWLLRPGQRAELDSALFDVAFINYYVPGEDAYMDVGS